ncbi:MAG: RHS repeat-associated core domain-containing protein [Dehalococcoidia bacterium]
MGQTTTDYIWDVAAGLPVVLQDGANTYVYGLDLISATDGAGDQTYFTSDGLGSTSDLTDEDGDAVASYTYDVFGAIRSQTGIDTLFRFNGQQLDDGGLYYLRARYYDPQTGRFLSRDPFPGYAEKPATQHPYAYALNNPCNYADPTGLASEGGFSVTRCHASISLEGVGRFPAQRLCLPFIGCTPRLEWIAFDDLAKLDVDVDFITGPSGTEAKVNVDQDTPPVGWALGLPGWRSKGYVVITTNHGTNVSVQAFFSRGFPFSIDLTLETRFQLDEPGDARWATDHRLSGSRTKFVLDKISGGSCELVR